LYTHKAQQNNESMLLWPCGIDVYTHKAQHNNECTSLWDRFLFVIYI